MASCCCAQSPIAYTSLTLVSKKRLTKTPLSVSIELDFKKSIFGVTPAVKPTTSQGISSPVSSIIIDSNNDKNIY